MTLQYNTHTEYTHVNSCKRSRWSTHTSQNYCLLDMGTARFVSNALPSLMLCHGLQFFLSLFTFFPRAVSRYMGAAMICLAWMSLAVLYWAVSHFLARPVERKCYWAEQEEHCSRQLFIQGHDFCFVVFLFGTCFIVYFSLFLLAHLHVVGTLRFMSGINPPSLPTPFYSVLVSISVFMALPTVFHSIKCTDNSPLSHSVLSVFFLSYWSFQLDISLYKSLPQP